jgi:hypothetical protein
MNHKVSVISCRTWMIANYHLCLTYISVSNRRCTHPALASVRASFALMTFADKLLDQVERRLMFRASASS